MSFQFFHVECYSRTAPVKKSGGASPSLSSILGEANRLAGSCPHVISPEAPSLIFGCPLDEVEMFATAWANDAKDTKGRTLRKDGLVLLAGVISAPETLSYEAWGLMRDDCVSYLQSRFGDCLKSIIEHTDEPPHWHIHFYCTPNLGDRFETLHAGRAAAAIAKNNGMLKGAQNLEYKRAMRGWQDDFFRQVGMKHGLARIGPARRRLSRAQWQAEQSVVRTTADCLRERDLAQSVIDAVETRAQSVLVSEKKNKHDRKSIAASKIQLQSEKEKWRRYGYKFGAFLGAIAMGTAQLVQKARTLLEKRALSELRRDMVLAELVANQKISSAAIQSATKVRGEFSKFISEAKIETETLRSELSHLRRLEDARNIQAAAVRASLGFSVPIITKKMGM